MGVIKPPAEHLKDKRWLIPITNSCNLADKRWLIPIPNSCNLACGSCAQLCGHFPQNKIWYLTPDQINEAIEQIKPYTNAEKGWNEVTIFGGEPTVHPLWDQILELLYSHAPMQFRVNTNGRLGQFPFQRDRNITYYVDKHSPEQLFTMTFAAAKDCIPDKADDPAYFWELAKKDCPIWATEGAMIYNGKAYFCEHAAAMDWLWFDGENGWDIEEGKNPFERTEEEIEQQAHKFCQHCGWCLREMGSQPVSEKTRCTASNYDLFPKKNNLVLIEPPPVMDRDYTYVEKTIDTITYGSEPHRFLEWEYVNWLLGEMQLFDETKREQAAKFLVQMAGRSISNFMHIGNDDGRWPLFMAAYFRQHSLVQGVSIAPNQDNVTTEVRRLGREYRLTFQQCDSDDYVGQGFDLMVVSDGREDHHFANIGTNSLVLVSDKPEGIEIIRD